MFGRMDGWFSKLKVTQKGYNTQLMSEGLGYSRLLYKGTESLCTHFQLLVLQ